MRVSQYNWNWWFVLSTISFILLVELSGFLPVKLTKTQDSILTICWIVWVLQFLPCLYIGIKPEENNQKQE
jgi:hypothetical protein